ncbi:MAG: putative selenium-dependent hydroxylase accessory protein YqeC [Deltaproteobacteria bacterium]|nr:putative selenium-dependent hydroxylase accessory protein YqeC [Deltaproteobacteria bacterium]MBW1954930.1 putative selenium-dependent hydroxylase accessory protein YqeC [Deltaproteobacteria bacterium]MBW2041555.1 putative selenium-dependent hydroxylase accessory protein YqeC [Deltaproteobacteria bacterium]MBW2131723.1 putative selenium-dependent hydroxylase accessory protein YqeC [Deltaproteobacteria bacterium]
MHGVLVSAFLLSGGGVISLVGAGGKTTLMFCMAKELAASGAAVLATTTTKAFMPTPGDIRDVVISLRLEDVLKRGRAKGGPTVFFAAAKEIPREKKLAGFAPEAIDEIAASGVFQWIVVEADGAAQRPLKAPGAYEPVIPAASGWVVGVCGLDGIGRPLKDTAVFRAERFAALSGEAAGAPVSTASLARVLVHPKGVFKGCPKQAEVIGFLNKADTPRAVSKARDVAAAVRAIKSPLLHRIVVGRLSPIPEILEIHQV